MAQFCEYCGKQMNGVVCDCPASAGAIAAQGNAPAQYPQTAQPMPYQSAAQPMQNRAPVPEGFMLDTGSGLYYKQTRGNDSSGRPGQWTTWFYPDTGKFAQDFTPDVPTATSAPAPTPQYAPQPAAPAPVPAQQFAPKPASPTPTQPFAPQYPQQAGYAPPPPPPPPQPMNAASTKKLSIIHIIIPVLGLIIGAVIAFIQYR